MRILPHKKSLILLLHVTVVKHEYARYKTQEVFFNVSLYVNLITLAHLYMYQSVIQTMLRVHRTKTYLHLLGVSVLHVLHTLIDGPSLLEQEQTLGRARKVEEVVQQRVLPDETVSRDMG